MVKAIAIPPRELGVPLGILAISKQPVLKSPRPPKTPQIKRNNMYVYDNEIKNLMDGLGIYNSRA